MGGVQLEPRPDAVAGRAHRPRERRHPRLRRRQDAGWRRLEPGPAGRNRGPPLARGGCRSDNRQRHGRHDCRVADWRRSHQRPDAVLPTQQCRIGQPRRKLYGRRRVRASVRDDQTRVAALWEHRRDADARPRWQWEHVPATRRRRTDAAAPPQPVRCARRAWSAGMSTC